MNKNLLFYIHSEDQKTGGARQYAFNMLKMISEVPNDDFKFFIYNRFNDPMFNEFNDNKKVFTFVNEKKIYKIKYKVIKKFYKFLKFISFKKIQHLIDPIDFIISDYKIDIIHSPFQILPNTRKAKLITTMHDVQELHFPEFFNSKERIGRAINNDKLALNSDRILVSFSHIKKDIVTYFDVEESKVEIFLISLNYLWIIDFLNKNKEIVQDIKGTYLLYPANAWKHKNHLKLLEAIYYLKEKGNKIKLVLTGDFSSEYGQFLKSKIVELNLIEEILCKGIVSQQELFDLYVGATAVVIPTLYEAGSYPLYEAITLEKPVICSNVTSLPETIGNDKFIFEPNNHIDIADKIESVYFDEHYKNESIQNSKKMKLLLMNNDSVKKLYKLYETL